jgi:uncharacterized membrane protein YgcG
MATFGPEPESAEVRAQISRWGWACHWAWDSAVWVVFFHGGALWGRFVSLGVYVFVLYVIFLSSNMEFTFLPMFSTTSVGCGWRAGETGKSSFPQGQQHHLSKILSLFK